MNWLGILAMSAPFLNFLLEQLPVNVKPLN